MFDSFIVYPIAVLIGLVSGLATRPRGWKRSLLIAAVAGAVSAIIGALEFSRYFGMGEFGEVALFVLLAALWCFVLAVVGFGAAVGVRRFVASTIRAFRGE
jgi:hypothetical protein